jgi:hypothetical protein
MDTNWVSNSGRVTGNRVAGLTGMVSNIMFGTEDPPGQTGIGIPYGTLYIKYAV